MADSTTAPRVWFITGASSGIGFAMTEYVLSQGDIAVATLRTPSAIADLEAKYPKTQLLVLKLDVIKIDDIVDGFKAAVETFGRIDIVFNNAGFAVALAPFSEVESTSMDVARQVFEVNFWGATNVAKEAVRVLRDGKKPGHIINISSLVSLKPPILGGYYASTKFALNGLLEGLAQELDPAWKIKITLVELGGFQTRALTHAISSVSAIVPHPAYASNPSLPSNQHRAHFAAEESAIVAQFGNPKKAAKVLDRLSRLEEKDIPLHFPLGLDAIELAGAVGKVYIEAAQKWKDWSSDLN